MSRDTNMFNAEENAKKLRELEERIKRLESKVFPEPPKETFGELLNEIFFGRKEGGCKID